MDNSKVSIIIPVYNPGEYLRTCLDSVIGQVYRNIEIICVDDGSTDGSGEILDEYAKKDERIKVIHKKNGGISSARNAGLKAAGGGYVVFIDSDDYVDSDYVLTLYQSMEGVDAAACGTRSVQAGVETGSSIPENKTYSTNSEIRDAYVSNKSFYKYFKAPHEKMYRRNVIGDLKFDESLLVAEDIIFNLNFLRCAGAVKTVSYCGYNVRARMDSITHKSTLRYSEFTESNYIRYRKIRAAGLKEWGFSNEFLMEGEKKAAPHLYFLQVSNLVLPGTPYSGREIREKIKELHEDKEFRQLILEQDYNGLPLKKKISKFSVSLNNPYLTEIMFYIVTRAQNTIIRSRRLSTFILGRRKR